jgi:hypothetical protein
MAMWADSNVTILSNFYFPNFLRLDDHVMHRKRNKDKTRDQNSPALEILKQTNYYTKKCYTIDHHNPKD